MLTSAVPSATAPVATLKIVATSSRLPLMNWAIGRATSTTRSAISLTTGAIATPISRHTFPSVTVARACARVASRASCTSAELVSNASPRFRTWSAVMLSTPPRFFPVSSPTAFINSPSFPIGAFEALIASRSL
ncbi:hypothetical protein VT84_37685 [Gemmata sp. SH-PL17]|nr:hypothetical protein VT84_37685 [Gemmata sp. SH-PL17]